MLCTLVPFVSMFITFAYCEVTTGRKIFNDSSKREECRITSTCCDGGRRLVGVTQVEQCYEYWRQNGALVGGARSRRCDRGQGHGVSAGRRTQNVLHSRADVDCWPSHIHRVCRRDAERWRAGVMHECFAAPVGRVGCLRRS